MARDIARSEKAAELRPPQRRTPVATTSAVSPLATVHVADRVAAGDVRSLAAAPLQRLAGNAAVAHVVARAQEQEEEQPASPAAVARRVGPEEEQPASPAATSPVLDVVGRGGGSPLDPAARRIMESGFGADFSDVRVHTGPAAAASAASVQAVAYTVGHEIVMPRGVDPGSAASMHTLAHELTHVRQQRSGPVEGTPMPGGITVSSPTDRFEQEAEHTAARVMAGLAGRH